MCVVSYIIISGARVFGLATAVPGLWGFFVGRRMAFQRGAAPEGREELDGMTDPVDICTRRGGHNRRDLSMYYYTLTG